ncbi:hypothetical protein LX36DRAFT_72355 [Colletotrichum falcatum]|nr:hypothetical protein LX36DRAFT_72355 [Colletotrichum falcatum]
MAQYASYLINLITVYEQGRKLSRWVGAGQSPEHTTYWVRKPSLATLSASKGSIFMTQTYQYILRTPTDTLLINPSCNTEHSFVGDSCSRPPPPLDSLLSPILQPIPTSLTHAAMNPLSRRVSSQQPIIVRYHKPTSLFFSSPLRIHIHTNSYP